MVTWEQLTTAEPKLADLLAEAEAARRRAGRRFCSLRAWYGRAGRPGIKARLLSLVGWERRPAHSLLSTSESYDVAYFTLLAALKDCRHQGAC